MNIKPPQKSPSPPYRFKSKRPTVIAKQQGYGILSVLLALSITSLVVAGQIEANRISDQKIAGATQAQIISSIKSAANNYILEQYPSLQNDTATSKNGTALAYGTAYGQSLNPTIANLIAMGYLPTSYSATAQLGLATATVNPTYRVTISKQPAACVATACNVGGLVWIDQPIWRKGSAEIQGIQIGSLIKTIGGDAIAASNAAPTQMTGPSGVTIPNPDPTQRPGIVGAMVGWGTTGYGQYLVNGDTRNIKFYGDFGVGAGTNAGAPCSLGGILTSGHIFSNAANCVQRAFLDGATGQAGVADASGITRALLDGSQAIFPA